MTSLLQTHRKEIEEGVFLLDVPTSRDCRIQFQKAINPPEKMIGKDMNREIGLVEWPGVNLLSIKHRK